MAARYWWGEAPRPTPAEPISEGTYRVVRVVDGDTIIFAPHSVVRLIGVNTPETVRPDYPVEPFGPEASAFTRRFLAGGTARLTLDRERTDRFGRFLAYVWVGEQMLNEELFARAWPAGSQTTTTRARSSAAFAPPSRKRARRAAASGRRKTNAVNAGCFVHEFRDAIY